MLRVEQQAGFVLHERAYRETSVILEVLSRDFGRVGLIVRGVRRERPRISGGSLRPFQRLSLSWQGRGELATLTSVESVGSACFLLGDRLLGGIYANELLVRLLQRSDPHPELFRHYGELVERLGDDRQSLAWSLRRFERELLAELGYAMQIEFEADSGAAIAAHHDYSYDPEHGATRWEQRPIAPRISGAALCALSGEALPAPGLLRQLRLLLRAQLLHQLGGRELISWSIHHPPPRSTSAVLRTADSD